VKRTGIIAAATTLLFAGGIAVGQNLNQLSQEQSVPGANCERSVPFTFTSVSRDGQHTRETPIWQVPDSDAFFFLSGMTIDADGAPNAYHPDNIGLDDLLNAGTPEHWDGIMTNGEGQPIVQGSNDPFPGYYVSCTSLSDRTKAASDPTRYVDATKIPYVVLPHWVADQGGARLGDFAYVVNLANGKSSYAIFADVGTLGEGSVALANNLGIWSDAREGGRRGGILYLVFPGSGNRQPRTVDEIQGETEKLVQRWGGMARLTSCSTNQQPTVTTTADAKPAPSASSESSTVSAGSASN
jgi:hypothetical protein